MSDLISVIIPTYNRYTYLLKTLESVKNQTHKNIEIIVVNDGSSQEEYYQNKLEGCIVLNMDKNSKQRFGHASPGGFQRSMGMKIASGEYYAFVDDDDYWMPDKLEKQLKEMKSTGCNMSCTDGYFGKGIYNSESKYIIYNKQKYFRVLQNIFNRKGKGELLKNDFPKIWNKEFLNVHNCCIASSLMIHKSIVDKIGYFSNQLWAPDYEYWKRVIEHTDCVYINEPLLYYDAGHGSGQNY